MSEPSRAGFQQSSDPFEGPQSPYDTPFMDAAVPHPTNPGADPGIRLLAQFLDGLLFGIPSFFISLAMANSSSGALFLFNFAVGLIALAYFVLMEAKFGKTLGKKVLGLEVQDAATGGRASVGQTSKRNTYRVLAFFSSVPIFGAVVTIVWIVVTLYIGSTILHSPDKQGVHDLFAGAGTKVVRTR